MRDHDDDMRRLHRVLSIWMLPAWVGWLAWAVIAAHVVMAIAGP